MQYYPDGCVHGIRLPAAELFAARAIALAADRAGPDQCVQVEFGQRLAHQAAEGASLDVIELEGVFRLPLRRKCCILKAKAYLNLNAPPAACAKCNRRIGRGDGIRLMGSSAPF